MFCVHRRVQYPQFAPTTTSVQLTQHRDRITIEGDNGHVDQPLELIPSWKHEGESCDIYINGEKLEL